MHNIPGGQPHDFSAGVGGGGGYQKIGSLKPGERQAIGLDPQAERHTMEALNWNIAVNSKKY